MVLAVLRWKRRTRQQLEYEMRVPTPERVVVIKQVCFCMTAPTPRLQPFCSPSLIRPLAHPCALCHDHIKLACLSPQLP